MKKFIKEPLVHFLLLGFMIFGYYYLNKTDDQSGNVIVIDDAEYDYLLGLWKNQWKRDPNEQEIKAFIDQYLRQEVFYKEALALNLDHNDIIVKRRLSQKMEAVSNDLNAMINPPDEGELRAFYDKNKSLFQFPDSYSFHQVLFTNNESNLQEEMEWTMQEMNDGQGIPKSLQLKLSLPNKWEDRTEADINKAFGGDFASTLDTLPINRWTGPVESGFGQHLVFVSKKDTGRWADFEKIKPYVEKEYEYQTELKTQEQVYRDLLEKYPVIITSKHMPERIKKSYVER
ncbi:peptidyl-prolyl cis-trans isomerase [Echinicola salinicaeni]|uniref:peptidylprolyl isomerase n=1 Tax=Echinicola salinicaeni TaxID=2762757 RepID=UPI001647790D|nr:peptidylprolyl isomerase [Echinicola salinicaeni]